MEPAFLSQSTGRRARTISLPAALSALCAILAGAALRVWMLHKFFEVSGDSQLYGSMAKNLLLHGRYAVSDGSGMAHETLIRLPGYPLFLAACFRLFGMENYFAPACIQIVADLAGCILLALLAHRITRRMSAAQATLWLACLCPFTAIFTAFPLTEAPTLFCIALAMGALARFQDRADWPSALAFTFAITYAALLRPDGALIALAFAPPMILALWRSTVPTGLRVRSTVPPDVLKDHDPGVVLTEQVPGGALKRHDPGVALKGHDFSRADSRTNLSRALAPEGWAPDTPLPQHSLSTSRFAPGASARKLLVCLLLALTPFAAWTIRNARVFHVFQPLAPRYATDPGEPTWPGFQRWMKTWCLDFISTDQVYWNMPGSPLDIHDLPNRAFDSPAQRAETENLFADYQSNGMELAPDLDARFAQLAARRIAAHPLRYYLWLPIGRVADMLFRPRVENLPIDLDWWVYAHHWAETRFSWFYVGLNAFYFLLAVAGLCMRPRLWPWMVLYFVLRCALLATIEAPEARYTIEFFPTFTVLGGIAISRLYTKIKRPGSTISRAATQP
jgi:hypothetical protein